MNDLAACSLVCRDWNEIVRPELFSRLDVRVSNTAKEFDPFGMDPIPIFLVTKHLDETAVAIVPCVKTLKL